MDFLNKLGKKASETYQATKEKATTLSEELKLKGKISDLKEKIQKVYHSVLCCSNPSAGRLLCGRPKAADHAGRAGPDAEPGDRS